MLSPNTLLNKARYRVDGLHLGGPTRSVYAARDQVAGTTVLIVEHQTEPSAFPEHEGLLKLTDRFLMNGRRYDVTEPVEADAGKTPVAKTWDQFSMVLMALNAISVVSTNRCEISPQTLVRLAKGGHKLLPIDRIYGPVEMEAWYVPIERIWGDLDHISQRAIYTAWDEKSIADLDLPLNESSDLYSLAALFYRVISGTTPPSAFERTVIGMDGGDPLTAPHSLRPEIGEDASAFLLRCMELRRERRFRSFEDAIMNLPTLSVPAAESEDESDALEVVQEPERSSMRVETSTANVEVLAPTTLRAEPPTIVEEVLPGTVSQHASVSSADAVHTTEDPIFTLGTSAKRNSGMKVAVAGLIVAIVGGIGWGGYQFGGWNVAATPNTVSAQVTAPVIRNEPPVDPTQTPVPASSPITVKDTPDLSADPAQGELPAKPDVPHQRPQIATKSAVKTAPAADGKGKKKVTVDDLINDN